MTPVFANPSSNDVYWYGYSWGGMHGACLAYKFNQMSKKDAKQSIQKMEKKSDSGADIYKNYVKDASSIRANTHSFYNKVTDFAKNRKLFWIFELG